MRWLTHFLSSSIGKKTLMALTGLALIGFLFVHLGGNLILYAGDDAFREYVEGIQAWGVLLYVAEAGLALLFLAHIGLGLRVSMENREARKERYRMRASRGGSTAGSLSMLVTGVVVLLFLVVHLWHFRFDDEFLDRPGGLVRETLSKPVPALVYLLGVAALTLHLTHAFQSACQTLGVNHPSLTPLLKKAGLGLGLLLGLGFASFPLVFLLGGGGN